MSEYKEKDNKADKAFKEGREAYKTRLLLGIPAKGWEVKSMNEYNEKYEEANRTFKEDREAYNKKYKKKAREANRAFKEGREAYKTRLLMKNNPYIEWAEGFSPRERGFNFEKAKDIKK